MGGNLAALARSLRHGAVVVVALATASVTSAAIAAPSGYPMRSAARPGFCDYYYEWLGKVRFPLQPDQHATYTYVAPSNQAGSDGIGFLVQGQFVHSVWTSWMTYTGHIRPYSIANFVNNPPENSNEPVLPNAGSIDPFIDGQRMLGKPRNFRLLFVPEAYKGRVARVLDGVPRAGIPKPNIKPYPTPRHGNSGNFWLLANRNYVAFPGYNPGGTLKHTFPTVTAVKLATGNPVDCQRYNQIPESLQRSPMDPPATLNYGRIPARIVLKNGSIFTGVDAAPSAQFSPANPKGLVLFTRPPIEPGADVATIPPPDNCSGYLGTSLDPRVISLIRIPHLANYTDGVTVTRLSTYPNRVDLSLPWQASYESVVAYGSSPGLYLPGSPRTNSLADQELKADATGGSTIIVWPRHLSRPARAEITAYAARRHWAIMRGGTAGLLTGANVLVRIKAAASNYYGSMSRLPCFYGTPADPRHSGVPWADVPIGTRAQPSRYVATGVTMGERTPDGIISAAPQGVTCSSVADLTSGKCLRALKKYIKSTGGSYFAPCHRHQCLLITGPLPPRLDVRVTQRQEQKPSPR